MRSIELIQPKRIVFGAGCAQGWVDIAVAEGKQRVLLLSTDPIWAVLDRSIDVARQKGLQLMCLDYTWRSEPDTDMFEGLYRQCESFGPQAVVSVGGGSVLDMGKLLAALASGTQKPADVFGKNLLERRDNLLICIPTTAGTGSEVSPNAILFDKRDDEKKGIISPWLVPDLALIDPEMTCSLPPKLTAETGMDALCHCIEAYTNKFAHPTVDLYALKGIEYIYKNLRTAVNEGNNIEARSAMALASMYGGLCLGPVNTSAVHALSYGLAGKYHFAHGLANAVLLPAVMTFNMEADLEKNARMALAMGLPDKGNMRATALSGVEAIRELSRDCGIPQSLSSLGV
jgi:alcohol dehydrogenase class IV